MKTKQELEKLAEILLDFSEILYLRGCDIARCEDTVHHIARAYGCEVNDVFAIPSLVILTIKSDGITVSENRRILTKRDTDFTIVEKLNSLSREICSNPLELEEVENRIKEINSNGCGIKQIAFGYFLGALGFAYFYSHNIITSLVSAVLSVLLAYICKWISKYCDNHTFYVFLVSIVNGLIICILSKIFPSLDINNIIIGEIMLLVPGTAITESAQHIFTGDTTSGQIQFIESVLTAALLASGYALSMLVMGVI